MLFSPYSFCDHLNNEMCFYLFIFILVGDGGNTPRIQFQIESIFLFVFRYIYLYIEETKSHCLKPQFGVRI